MTAGPVQLGDNVGDGVSDARDLGEPTFCNQPIDRNGESGHPLRGSRPWRDTDCRRTAVRCAYSRSSVATGCELAFDIPSFSRRLRSNPTATAA